MRLEAAIRLSGVVLVNADDLDGAHGCSRPGRIDVLATLGPVDRLATLAHEWAHELLHQQGERPASRTMRETEAEAVAFIVTTAVGVTPSVAARDYTGLYDGSADTLRTSLGRIQRTARTILDAIQQLVTVVGADAEVPAG